MLSAFSRNLTRFSSIPVVESPCKEPFQYCRDNRERERERERDKSDQTKERERLECKKMVISTLSSFAFSFWGVLCWPPLVQNLNCFSACT